MYLRYIIQENIEDQSAVFERALKVWGLELDKGNAIWDLYAKYSQSEAHKAATITRRRCALAINGSAEIYESYIKTETDPSKVDRINGKHKNAQVKLG